MEGINATCQLVYLSTLLISPNPSLHPPPPPPPPPWNLGNWPCISYPKKRIALHTAINTSQYFFDHACSTLLWSNKKSQSRVLGTGVVALTCFFFRAKMACNHQVCSTHEVTDPKYSDY